jgi:hypothetical protein
MSNIFDMEQPPMPTLSYREKSLYASFVAELLVYGLYFFLQVVVQLIIALFTRNRVTDERDHLIELRGYRAGYLTFASLMVLGLAMLWFHASHGHLDLENPMIGLHFLNVFFGMLVIADITRTATQIVSYRRAL